MSCFSHFIKHHSIIKYAGMFQPVADLKEAVALVNRVFIKSEIIGSWLYCFTTPLIGFQLELLGFWYSYKHQAFIFSGGPKGSPADEESLDEIRTRLGSISLIG